MRRVLFRWRSLTVYSYPAMLYVGIVSGVLGATSGAALHAVDPSRFFAAILTLVAPAVIGSRILCLLLHWSDYRGRPARIWERSAGGAAMYGGLALAILVSVPLLRILGVPFGSFWDAAMITILIGMVFTRVGIYAGPEGTGLSGLNTPYRWQVWLGVTDPATSTTKFTQIKPVTPPIPPPPLVEPNKTNYLAVTYDGSRVKLYSAFEGKFGAMDLAIENLIGIDEPLIYAPNPGPEPFQIGIGRDLFQPFNTAGDPRYPFVGKMQEVAVYSQALAPERVISHLLAAMVDV